jgi:dTDP-4-amino-4,6-dideoxygalactose transaminase
LDELGARLFCIPTHPAMSDEDNAYISAASIECIETLR